MLCLLSRIRSREAVMTLRCVKLVKSSVKFWSFTLTSFFVVIVLFKPNTHCGVSAKLIVCQNGANNDCLYLRRALKVNGLLTLLGLEISFQEWYRTILDVKVLHTSVLFCGCDPMLRLICSSTCDTILCPVQIKRNTNDLI